LRDCSLYSLTVQNDQTMEPHMCRKLINEVFQRLSSYISLLNSKIELTGGSGLLNCLNRKWTKIGDELKIWVHHARAIESCILQIGQLSRGHPKFLRKDVQDYVLLCKEVRHIGYHVNSQDAEWNFDPINPSFLADMIKGVPKFY
jgi:hypothetical protein